MSIRVKIDDVVFEVDTAQEAVELQRALAAARTPVKNGTLPRVSPPNTGVATVTEPLLPLYQTKEGADYEGFARRLNDNGKAIVRAMVTAYPKPLSTNELSTLSGIAPMSMPPVIKHVRNAASSNGIDPEKFLSRKQVISSEGVKSEYALSDEGVQKLRPVAESWQPIQT
jgi:hypothetical protein